MAQLTTGRHHVTEKSATDRKIQRTGRSQNWLRADCWTARPPTNYTYWIFQ